MEKEKIGSILGVLWLVSILIIVTIKPEPRQPIMEIYLIFFALAPVLAVYLIGSNKNENKEVVRC